MDSYVDSVTNVTNVNNVTNINNVNNVNNHNSVNRDTNVNNVNNVKEIREIKLVDKQPKQSKEVKSVKSVKLYTYKGVTDTLYGLCKSFNANYTKVKYRLKLGFSVEDAFDYKPNKFVHERGKIFTVKGVSGGLRDLCEHFGVNYNTVYARIRKGMNVEEAINYALSLPPAKEPVIYTYNGVSGNIASLCRLFNCNPHTVRYRLKNGMSIDEAIESKERVVINPNHKVYVVNGIVGSKIQLAKAFGLEYNTVKYRMRIGMSLEEALTHKGRIQHSNVTVLTVKGVTGTVRELANHFNISTATVYDRLVRGWSAEDAFLKPANPTIYTAYGVSGTLRELCEKFNVSYNAVYYRIKKGSSAETAIDLVRNVY